MRTSATAASVSRRTALTAIGGGGLGLALAAHGQRAAAQEDPPPALAGHPQVGVWMVDSPIGRAIAVYAADGSVVTALAASQTGPQGVTFSSTQIGTWESTGERGTHRTGRAPTPAPSRSTPTRRSARTGRPGCPGQDRP